MFFMTDVSESVHYTNLAILPCRLLNTPVYNYLTVRLFYIVSMATVWVRPTPKAPSAVISSPKSFVIALICILQLSVLAHS